VRSATSSSAQRARLRFPVSQARLDAAIAKARAKAAATDSTPLVPWRLHDLRRTGASTLARLGFDTIAIDKLLAHQPTKRWGVAAIYQRYDFAEERARALDAWAEHVVTRNARQRERPLDTARSSSSARIGRISGIVAEIVDEKAMPFGIL
jgi:hypothetical protein